MSKRSEEAIILKLLLKGQSEADITEYLEKKGLLNGRNRVLIESKVREMKAAQAFLPSRPAKKRIRIYAILLILVGCFVTYLFWGSPVSAPRRYNPGGYAILLIIIGFILLIWPDKGGDHL